jgi:hypothetical protein
VAQNIGWAARPGLREIFLPYLLLHEPFRFQQHSHEPAVLRLSVALGLLLFAPPLIALAWRTFARGGRKEEEGVRVESESREKFAVRFLLFFSAAPVVATFLLAHLLPHSVWGTRHLIVIAPAYLLLAAHAVASLRPGWLAACVCALLGCWLALAAAVFVTRRHTPPVWCAWGTLARAAESEGEGIVRPEGDDSRRDDRTPARVRAGSDEPIKVYAFEDLVAYHLWHESVGGGGRRRGLRVVVVRGLEGVAQDRAFFLPRGFDEVEAVAAAQAFTEGRFWLAFRGAAWDAGHPAVRALAARGYEFGPRHEVRSHGQTSFMVLAARR